MQLLPLGGTTRLPPLAALGWIIAYYVEFGKIRGTDCHVGALPLLAMTGNRSARLSFGAETDAHVIARSASDAAIRFSPAPGDVF